MWPESKATPSGLPSPSRTPRRLSKTNIYGDELTSAESLAQGVMQGNLIVKEADPKTGQPVNQETGQKVAESRMIRSQRGPVKPLILGIVTLAALVIIPAGGKAQRLGSEITDRLKRLNSERPVSRRVRAAIPFIDTKCHAEVVCAAAQPPDLGEAYFPLAPSIGPGSPLAGTGSGARTGQAEIGG